MSYKRHLQNIAKHNHLFIYFYTDKVICIIFFTVSVAFLLLIIFTIFLWHYWRKIVPYIKYRNYILCEWSFVRLFFLHPRNISQKDLIALYFKNFLNISKKYQEEGFFVILFPSPGLVVYGEEAVKFFSNEPSLSNKPERFYKFINLISKNSLFRSNGKIMKKQRKLIGPAFYPKVLKDIAVVMNEHAAYLTEDLMQLENYTAKDLGKVIEYRTLVLFFETSLGIKPESADKDGRTRRFLHLISEDIDYIMYRMTSPWLYFDFMLKFFQEGRKHLKVREEIKIILKELTEEMMDSVDSRTASMNLKDVNQLHDPAHHKCFGEILIEEHVGNPSFTIENLKMELITLIIAGYDTVSQALTFTLWLLGQNEYVQEKAYEEIMSIDADVIKYEDAPKFKYLECIIKESLRLYPVVPLFGRYSNKDIQFGKYTIPKGLPIGFSPYALNYNPELYPNPEMFNPDRFFESTFTAKPWTQIFFAEGVRPCIGKNYALLVMKIFLAHVIRDFRLLSLTKKEDFVLTWSMMLRSSKPLAVKFIPR